MSTIRHRTVAAGRLLALGLLVTGVALAGCSGGNGGKSAAPATAANRAAAPADGLAAQAPEATKDQADTSTQSKANGQPLQAPAATDGRSVIYTGVISVRVSDVDRSANALTTLATGVAGYVSADQRTAAGQQANATVTVRVPSDKFDSFVDSVSHLGTELSRQLSTEDVTAKMVDLTSRLKTQQASVNRIRALMSQAKTIGDVTMLEGELTSREADLESLEAQQRSLADLTALSTVTVTLLAPEAAAPAKPKHKDGGFLAGLSSGWHAFVRTLSGLLTVLGAILPFVLAIGLPLWLALYLARRHRASARPVTPAESTGPAGSAAG